MRIKIAEHETIEDIENKIKDILPDRYRLRLQTILLAKKGMHPNITYILSTDIYFKTFV